MRPVREQLLTAADLTEVVNHGHCSYQILMKMQIRIPESGITLNAMWTKYKLPSSYTPHIKY